MKDICFNRLILRGFGPYRDGVEIELSDGINTYVAKNETGKSSIVMGLLATIFGLPGKTDPAEFGQARFKNWDNPSRFEGELYFSADGVQYRIARDFQTHRISLARYDNGGFASLVSGEHNPGAKKPNLTYEKWLHELFGLTSRELFESTFCITQPLPGDRRLDNSIQSLLSGAGADFMRALGVLVEELKNMTRNTGDRGITPSNQRKDRDLEKLDSEIARLKSQIEECRARVDSLEALKEKQAKVTSELEKTRIDLAAKRSILGAWSDWRRLSGEYRQLLGEQVRISNAVDSAKDLIEKIKNECNEIQRLYPELDITPDDMSFGANDLASLKGKLNSWSARLSTLERDLENKKANAERRLREIDEQISAFEKGQADFHKRYAGISSLAPGASDTISKKLKAIREERMLNGRLQECQQKLKVSFGARLGAGLALAALTGILIWLVWGRFAGFTGRLASLATGIIFGLLGYYIGSYHGSLFLPEHKKIKAELETLVKRLSDLRHEMSTLDQALGDFASNDEAGLGALYEKAKQRDEDAAALGERKACLPGRDEKMRAQKDYESILGEIEQARQRREESRRYSEHMHGMLASLETLFQQYAVTSLESLAEKRIDIENRAGESLSRLKDLMEQNPGLPGVNEIGDVEILETRYRSLVRDVRDLEGKVESLMDESHELEGKLARLEGQNMGVLNIAQAEIELSYLQKKRDEAGLVADALTEACKELKAAITDYQETHRSRLEKAATRYFKEITGVDGRAVVIDDEFKIHVEDDGRPCDIAQLSKGAQDQLYIALRLAIADLLASDIKLPLIFDDPFVSCDSGRLSNLAKTLGRVGKDRQILALSHNEGLLTWGVPAKVSRK